MDVSSLAEILRLTLDANNNLIQYENLPLSDFIINSSNDNIEFYPGSHIRKLGFESEEIMRAANNKFERRFRAMEQYLAAQGYDDMTQLELEQMESAWQEIKKVEKKNV